MPVGFHVYHNVLLITMVPRNSVLCQLQECNRNWDNQYRKPRYCCSYVDIYQVPGTYQVRRYGVGSVGLAPTLWPLSWDHGARWGPAGG